MHVLFNHSTPNGQGMTKECPYKWYQLNHQLIEVLHGGHVACQEQYNIIPMGQNVHSI